MCVCVDDFFGKVLKSVKILKKRKKEEKEEKIIIINLLL